MEAGQSHADADAWPLYFPTIRPVQRDADVADWDDERWQARHESHLSPDSAVFVAVGEDDGWLGQMAVHEFTHHCPPKALLLGVYVTPSHRGDGTAASLLCAVESWVFGRGLTALNLDVHEHALPAQRFYERHGYRRTGFTHPYPLDPTTSELEMVKVLTQQR